MSCFVLQGVVKALFEHRMLPRVLAGSSVGSIVAGLVATRTDDELRETFRSVSTAHAQDVMVRQAAHGLLDMRCNSSEVAMKSAHAHDAFCTECKLPAAHEFCHISAQTAAADGMCISVPCRKLDNVELSFFNNSRAVDLVHSFLQKGALHDMSFLQVSSQCLYAMGPVSCPAPDVQRAAVNGVQHFVSIHGSYLVQTGGAWGCIEAC